MITQKDANVFFYWVFELCFVKHAGDASVASILGYNRSKLICDEEVYCHFQRPEKFIETLGIRDYIPVETVVSLFTFLVTFRLVAFYMINYRLKH